jgi:CRISPR-associated protein Cmr6
VIPGSSIKGALRSPFKSKAWGFLGELLLRITNHEWSHTEIESLEDEIFEGLVNGTKQSSSKCDVFFDAQVCGCKDKLYDEDNLTPHTKGIFSEPVPLLFLKVAAGVEFSFSFTLHDHGKLTPDQKKELCKQLLLIRGVGAKTNVGYGYFEFVPDQLK